MIRHRLRSRLVVSACIVLTAATALAQTPVVLSDKVTDLAGEWKLDASRGTGGICGVREYDSIAFEIVRQPPSVSIRNSRVSGSVPIDGSPVSLSGQTAVATTDAGWLKLTMTKAGDRGYANVMQEVYILNRDRSELTLWRTLNTVLPDGSSGKIDCGNRSAAVFVRQSGAK